MQYPDKETSKRIILNGAVEMEKFVTQPGDDKEAYHHANFILTQVILSLLAFTDDVEVYQAVDDILSIHQVITDRIGARPHIIAEEDKDNAPAK